MTKIKLGIKGLIWLTLSYHYSSKEIKAEAVAEAMKDYSLLPMMLSQLLYSIQGHRPAVSHPHSHTNH